MTPKISKDAKAQSGPMTIGGQEVVPEMKNKDHDPRKPQGGWWFSAAMVSAAYLAAAQGQTLQRRYILEGVREEWRKAGRLNFPELVFPGWVDGD